MRRFAAALLSLTLMTGAARSDAAAPSGFANLTFEQTDAAGQPLGWQVRESGVKVTRECAPACTLRFTGSRGAQYGLVQQFLNGDGGGAGRRLVLSGRLRSEGFNGTVQPQVAAFVSGRPVISEYPDARAVRGNTDWREFRISLPIVPNTERLGIAIGVSGEGSLWIDRLDVRFDDGAPVQARAIELPPRPAPFQALLDDEALRLDAAAMPPVSEAWRADVLARQRPIRSLFSDDFSDLQFLKPLLEGKRVVQLGESSHGVAEFNLIKTRLIKFLHQELGYDVIAFENPLVHCYDADAAAVRLPAQMLMNHCVMGVWSNADVLPLFEYVKASRAGARPLTLAGFDTQLLSIPLVDQGQRLAQMLKAVNSPLAAQARTLLAPLAVNPADADARVAAFLQQAAAVLEKRRERLLAKGYSADLVTLKIQSLRSHQRLLEQLKLPRTGNAGLDARDAGMAANLNFLLDTLYAGRKVIVWAHNDHIAYAKGPGKFIGMGAHLARTRKAELYTIGLYMGRGVAAHNDGSHYEIAAPAPGSLEAVLANGGWKYAFADLAGGAASWPNQPLNVREWGLTPEVFTPAQTYDGLIYIDTVTPPEPLRP